MSELLQGMRDGWSQSRLSQRGIVLSGIAGSTLAALGLIASQLI